MAVAWRWQSAGQYGWKKNDGRKGNGNIGSKKHGQIRGGVIARAANSMAKFGLRAKALGNTGGNERANLHCGRKQ